MRLPLGRYAALFAVSCALVTPALAQEPAKPAASPTCTAARLVGTWERVSLLRNALSVQPPDAPLFVKFGADGYWSMMEMPDDRPTIAKPLDQMTARELFTRFDKVEGGQGTWTVKADGSVVTRRHLVNIAPGGENSNQDRLCWFEGEILALVGTGANRSPQARFKRLTAPQSKPHPLVGTWEQASLAVDGKPSPLPAAAIVIIGEDGWFSATQLPAGRKPAGKPMEQYTVDDYVRSFSGVEAGRGTYTVEGTTLRWKHVANIDPNLVGSETVAQYSLAGDTLTLRATTAGGAKFVSTYRRPKPLDTIAK